MTTNRRKLREAALQILYLLEYNSTTIRNAFRDQKALLPEAVDDQEYLRLLVEGVAARRDEIDATIRMYSTNWRLERMAVVDRNILRLATFELAHVPDVPRKVCINEAIEVAKRFGGDDSPSFINGILDRIALEIRGSDENADEEAASPEEEGPEDEDRIPGPPEEEEP